MAHMKLQTYLTHRLMKQVRPITCLLRKMRSYTVIVYYVRAEAGEFYMPFIRLIWICWGEVNNPEQA